MVLRHSRHPGALLLHRVALLIETSKAFGRGLLLGVGRYARLHGQWSTYVDERGLADPVPAWLESGEFDGIIARAAHREMLDHVISFGIPTICLGEENPSDAISVVNDDARCAELAAQHLMERQFRNFAFLGHGGLVWSDARRDHFMRTLATAGMHCEVLEFSVETTPGCSLVPASRAVGIVDYLAAQAGWDPCLLRCCGENHP